jgi:hypothetical protein
MIAAVTATAALEPAEQYDETRQLAWLDRFLEHAHRTPHPPDATARARMAATRDDIVWLQRRDRAGRAARSPGLGWLYRGFEALGTWLQPAQDPSAPMREPLPGPMEAEYRMLDRLSLWYGGQYRGAIVLNYGVAAIAGFVAVFGPWASPYAARRIGVFEVACLAIIVGTYLVGYTPAHGRGAGGSGRLRSRRWRQRWMEYRLLAERFRYASLLQPFAGTTEERWRRLIVRDGVPLAWYDEYFLWRLAQQEPHAPARDAWRAWLLGIMEHQARYHGGTGMRRQHLAHVLERATRAGFCVAAACLVLYVSAEWIDAHRTALVASVVAGFATAGTAAIHGILRTVELGAVGDASLEAAARIRRLQEDVAALPPDAPVEALAPAVEAFCRLVTEEASGWTALMRDKEIPLAH